MEEEAKCVLAPITAIVNQFHNNIVDAELVIKHAPNSVVNVVVVVSLLIVFPMALTKGPRPLGC